MTTWTEKDSELLVYGWVREPELMSCAIGWKLPARAIAHIEAQAARIRELEARVVELTKDNEGLLDINNGWEARRVKWREEQEALRAQLAASIPREKLADALEAATGRCRCRLDLAKEVRSGTFPPMDETTKGVAGE